jgi:hypothetical protein
MLLNSFVIININRASNSDGCSYGEPQHHQFLDTSPSLHSYADIWKEV